MTRPIYEPSLTRTDAVLGYGSDQLFRRPAPSGAGTCGPYAYIGWFDGATIATGTTTNFSSLTDFDEGYVSDPALLSVNLALAKIILDPTEGPGSATLPGVWLAHSQVIWASNFVGTKWATVNWTMPILGAAGAEASAIGESATGGVLSGDSVSCTSLKIVTGGAGNNWINGALRQDSGVNQDLAGVVLTAILLCEYPAPNGVFLP